MSDHLKEVVQEKYPLNEVIDWAEVCRRLSISQQTLRRWKREGLPFIEVSSRLHRYKWEDVLGWLEERKVGNVKTI